MLQDSGHFEVEGLRNLSNLGCNDEMGSEQYAFEICTLSINTASTATDFVLLYSTSPLLQ